jgi:hypothetical protein
MQYMVVGLFGSYADAEAAVRDLELAGIVGEQVEVISDIDQDARTANIQDEPSASERKRPESSADLLSRLNGSPHPEV